MIYVFLMFLASLMHGWRTGAIIKELTVYYA